MCYKNLDSVNCIVYNCQLNACSYNMQTKTKDLHNKTYSVNVIAYFASCSMALVDTKCKIKPTYACKKTLFP